MNGFARPARVLAAVLAGFCVLAAPAGATEFCVQPADGCAGGQKPTIQAGLNAALASVGPDTVRLPAGTVIGPGFYDSANPANTVSVVGAGREATVVTSVTSTASDYSLDLRNGATLSDLTLKQFLPAVANQSQLQLSGTAERVGLSSSTYTEYPTIYGTVRHLSAIGPEGLHMNGTMEDSEVTGGALYTGTGDTIIRRSRVVSPSGTGGQNHSLVVSSSLLVLTTGAGAILATEPSAVANAQGTTVLSNVTLIGSGDPGCIGIEVSAANGLYTAPDDYAVEDATIANTIVRNCKTTLERTYYGGHRITNVTVLNSDIDLSPLAVTQVGAGTLTAGPGDGNINVDPLFVGLNGFDQELRFSSPVIDQGFTSIVSTEESATDLNGNPRIVDGNGDGVAKRDIGAFEYQRRPPVVTVSASAATAVIGDTVTFKGSATATADPGETVTGLAWRFDDGAVATGSDARHAFITSGAHTATLTATDSAGATGSATATVTVLAGPAGSAVTSLSLSPKTFRAASKGASTAVKQKKRPPVGTTVKLGLSAPSAVTLRVLWRSPSGGRRSGKACVAPTSRNRRAKKCPRTVTVRGSVIRASGAPGRFRFTGRIGGNQLGRGRFILVAQVGKTPAKTAAFKIVG